MGVVSEGPMAIHETTQAIVARIVLVVSPPTMRPWTIPSRNRSSRPAKRARHRTTMEHGAASAVVRLLLSIDRLILRNGSQSFAPRGSDPRSRKPRLIGRNHRLLALARLRGKIPQHKRDRDFNASQTGPAKTDSSSPRTTRTSKGPETRRNRAMTAQAAGRHFEVGFDLRLPVTGAPRRGPKAILRIPGRNFS
jgi:hypothetical protein